MTNRLYGFKGVIWIHNTKSDQMVLKGVNCDEKLGQMVLKRSQLGYTMIKLDQMVLKGVIRVHNGLERSQLSTQFKIKSYGLERSQFGTEYKNQVKWS